MEKHPEGQYNNLEPGRASYFDEAGFLLQKQSFGYPLESGQQALQIGRAHV